MSRLNWNDRHSPTDFDNSAPAVQPLDFDYTHAGGACPWPEKHGSIKFGPALIRRALASGLLVYAEVENVPYPVMVKETRWESGTGVFQVQTLEKWAIPRRVFTRSDAKGLTASGLLIER
jgi:hypothetical protein